MPHGIRNWTFDDVVKFLKKHDFVYNYARGSHHFYIGFQGGVSRQVLVPFHGKKSINPRTMKSIIIQSGILQEKWVES